ncbi:MAG: aminodeoxychorismate synthase component I, partial [Kangiellaceae bacterium]|nr:aminodeoxychorismate synthase component I [Kangiellaceae bacterium]
IHLPSRTNDSPLETMRNILASLRSSAPGSKPTQPFNGGWLGYISYDFGRYLEKLPDLTDDQIQLPWLKFGLYQWALITDHKLQQTNLHNFGLSEPEWAKIEQMVSEKLTGSPLDNTRFQITSNWKSNTSKQEYSDTFEKIKHYIYAGDCYQVNYAQQFSTSYVGDEFKAYSKLSVANKAPFSAYMNFDDHKILSLSPERFIEAHGRKVITQPIKGTRPRSSDPIEDKKLGQELCDSEKDRAENLMIVDLLRNDLSRTAAKGSVKVSELFGHYRFQSVHHLISTIESKLNDKYDNFDLLATTLPGGSITGAPKIRAMEIIEELEKVKRNLYCGVIGYIDFNGNMDTNICIRTLVAKDNKLYCWAGGGLVADSEMEQEYQETFDKLGKILPVLSPEAVQPQLVLTEMHE